MSNALGILLCLSLPVLFACVLSLFEPLSVLVISHMYLLNFSYPSTVQISESSKGYNGSRQTCGQSPVIRTVLGSGLSVTRFNSDSSALASSHSGMRTGP